MAQRNSPPKIPVVSPGAPAAAKKIVSPQSWRESVESIVIAFVLAFLFRTFQAEAFVIPTGSMAPTLMGQHKDVDCSQCGQRYRVSASDESPDQALRHFSALQTGRSITSQQLSDYQTVAGTCPNCRHTMAFRSDLAPNIARPSESIDNRNRKTYSGDRILVNKFAYSWRDPERWDVVVFKYPGNAQMNYIKRLVGLPNETLRIYQGDVFTKPNAAGSDWQIARKPLHKQLAMRQLVHDTAHDATALQRSGWPLRWSDPAGDWQVKVDSDTPAAPQSYRVTASATKGAWLRYRHAPASMGVWDAVLHGGQGPAAANAPQLINDLNAYNTEVKRKDANFTGSLKGSPTFGGLHWVGDVMVEVDLETESATGEVTLEVVEAGVHFQCRFDLATGKARLQAVPFAETAPSPALAAEADSHVQGVGEWNIKFANFDDELTVWVDGVPLDFGGKSRYRAEDLFADRSAVLPKTSEQDAGDLSPAAVGVQGAEVSVNRLQVWRDLYYIACDYRTIEGVVTDFSMRDLEEMVRVNAVDWWSQPKYWEIFTRRRQVEFPLGEGQLFVMGDNSAASQDCRLWMRGDGSVGHPGGSYLETSKLIGKATFVYWPHSWNKIPGTPIPFPLFPNVSDMRLIR